MQKFVETLVVARKRTDENGGKPKMDAVPKKAGEAKAIFERGQQLCSKNGQLYLCLRETCKDLCQVRVALSLRNPFRI